MKGEHKERAVYQVRECHFISLWCKHPIDQEGHSVIDAEVVKLKTFFTFIQIGSGYDTNQKHILEAQYFKAFLEKALFWSLWPPYFFEIPMLFLDVP